MPERRIKKKPQGLRAMGRQKIEADFIVRQNRL